MRTNRKRPRGRWVKKSKKLIWINYEARDAMVKRMRAASRLALAKRQGKLVRVLGRLQPKAQE
jgi:hypothetical protein